MSISQGMSQVLDSVEAGRAAASNYAWKEAFELLSAADADGSLTPRDIDALAEAAWWTGRLDEAMELHERAYAAHVEVGDKKAAAMVALTLFDLHGMKMALSVASGWLSRAERLLENLPESVEHAHLAVARTVKLALSGDLDGAIASSEGAYELGARFEDRDVQALALVLKGRALTVRGDVDEGLALLDEATAAAVSGELTPYSAGSIYCFTISACQRLGDVRRAAEWTDAANRWCDRLDVTGIPGACRVHRAEIMRLRGDWPKAEQQALEACAELHDFNRWVTASGFKEIGEIRRRRGDFAAAEEAYARVNELGDEPEPGRSLLRLAQGKVDTAVASIHRALEALEDPLSRGRLLPAQVEIALAAGDVKAAAAAAYELESIADTYRIDGHRTPFLAAEVELLWGQISLAEERFEKAGTHLRKARQVWQEIGAPYEEARARMLLGVAYRRQGDEDGATTELEGALAAFERLGAALDAERTKELLGRLEARRTFMFTDVVSSTELMQILGPEKWQKALAKHDGVLRELISASSGEVIKQTGDGFFAAFDGPGAAVEAAVAIQRALDDELLSVRIGLHTGGAFHAADHTDYAGEGVHVAARVGAAAGPGEIRVSEETLHGAAIAYPLVDPRDEELKGIGLRKLVAVDWH